MKSVDSVQGARRDSTISRLTVKGGRGRVALNRDERSVRKRRFKSGQVNGGGPKKEVEKRRMRISINMWINGNLILCGPGGEAWGSREGHHKIIYWT